MGRAMTAFFLAGAMLASGAAAARGEKAVPYWVSISAAKARMRTGPGANFPANWEYVRADLPLQVVQVHKEWRKVRDPDGAEGWMRSFLLSEQRTAIVRGGIQPLHASPDTAAKIVWRVEPGVVGRIARCASGWCAFDVHGRSGYVRTTALWGVDPGEAID